jgi:D-sedoheptulose 7-phosphate isomerase
LAQAFVSEAELITAIHAAFDEMQALLATVSIPDTYHRLAQAAHLIAACLQKNGKIICCGNGGSMSDAMHFAEELTGRFRQNRPAYAAIALSDPSFITCVANDFGYETVFARGVEAYGQPGDILLAISTGGNSANILRAAETALVKQMKIIALTGKDGGKLGPLATIELRVPHQGYADRIQEIHIKFLHVLVQQVELLLPNQTLC